MLKRLLSPFVLIGSVLIGGGLFTIVLLLITWSRPPRAPVGLVTAALTVIPAPTATPTPIVVETEATTLPAIPEGSSGGTFALGAFVKVSGTGGAGLRLRTMPGLEGEPLYLGMEDEIFTIEAGPEEADGYTWWYLVTPIDPNRKGWAAANYLEIVQEP